MNKSMSLTMMMSMMMMIMICFSSLIQVIFHQLSLFSSAQLFVLCAFLVFRLISAMSQPLKRRRSLNRIFVDVAITFALDDDYFIKMSSCETIYEMVKKLRCYDKNHRGGYKMYFEGCVLDMGKTIDYYNINYHRIPIIYAERIGLFSLDDELLHSTSIDAYEDELSQCQ